MKFDEILYWLRENDPEKLQKLWDQAEQVRSEHVGALVWLRGLVEVSNVCRRSCLYCGIRAENRQLVRYRLTFDEVLDAARLIQRLGFGTIVLQSGEDIGLDADWMTRIIQEIKRHTGLIVTLSLGERTELEYRQWFQAGANRYLLRFETSNEKLFQAIHPPAPGVGPVDRMKTLQLLREIGYQIGSGGMAGIPGQTWSDLARDIELFAEHDLDMIGNGPYLLHPSTPLGKIFPADLKTGLYRPEQDTLGATSEQLAFFTAHEIRVLQPSEQVVCDENLPFKVIALSRLVCPNANIPSTTAIATLDPIHGRVTGLSRGANVVMPNMTPTKYRRLYEIYPNKAASDEQPEQTHLAAIEHIRSIGRIPEGTQQPK